MCHFKMGSIYQYFIAKDATISSYKLILNSTAGMNVRHVSKMTEESSVVVTTAYNVRAEFCATGFLSVCTLLYGTNYCGKYYQSATYASTC